MKLLALALLAFTALAGAAALPDGTKCVLVL